MRAIGAMMCSATISSSAHFLERGQDLDPQHRLTGAPA
jgi:hypothetical protein